MLALYFILCILQPICLPVPELVTIVWGSNTVGDVYAFIFGVIGTVLGIVIMYFSSRKASDWIVQKFHYKDGLEAFKSYVSHFQIYIIGLLFVVPILPDEIICIGVCIIGISFSKFITIAIFAKITSIGMIAFSEQIGSVFCLDKWQIIMVELGVLLLIARIFKYIDCCKSVEENKNNKIDKGEPYGRIHSNCR